MVYQQISNKFINIVHLYNINIVHCADKFSTDVWEEMFLIIYNKIVVNSRVSKFLLEWVLSNNCGHKSVSA